MSLNVGDSFPSTVFSYVPYAAESTGVTACGNPIPYDTSKKFQGKKVVIVAVPGAFTPTCTANHIPPYLSQVEKFKAAGVDQVIVLSANDPFVNNAWGKALNGIKEDNFVIFASDPNAKFSQSIDRSLDLTDKGLGIRTSRYAIVVDNNKVVYNEQEPGSDVSVSSAETVLSKL
ncbi:Redoxin [Nadsonia fulvescens var. elongata DSM 6958]|uniref:Thioredoxin peroxidase n=1 Tax=Nadsonia fulvescens var. elongata DSM 6958 TaxID=857566 RepID=A0A1E3PT03_9ASCO|nr:Redoxin [Nadsonia fulvescens var. elongata DSM 6958]